MLSLFFMFYDMMKIRMFFAAITEMCFHTCSVLIHERLIVENPPRKLSFTLLVFRKNIFEHVTNDNHPTDSFKSFITTTIIL